MKWTAIITEKSKVDQTGNMTYAFDVLGDGETFLKGVSVTGNPTSIQDSLCERVTLFAQSYELADALPSVGDELVVIEDKK